MPNGDGRGPRGGGPGRRGGPCGIPRNSAPWLMDKLKKEAEKEK